MRRSLGRIRPTGGRVAPHPGWVVLLLGTCGMVALPIFALLALATGEAGSLWPHIAANVLPHALRTTAILLLGVGLVAAFIGTGTAWLVTTCRFPGRAAFEWLLLLPLAFPTYISAYSYVEILDPLGPVQGGLRALFGWESRSQYWFPEIRSLPGAIFVMGFALYPYVYLTARVSFLMQSSCVLEASRTLGETGLGAFRRIALPLARPAIAAGTALAMLEALNDLGAAQFFGVQTLTVSVYATWLSRGSLAGAAQIATFMLATVFVLMALERSARGDRRYFHTTTRQRTVPRMRLDPSARAAVFVACGLPVMLGFGLPGIALTSAALRRIPDQFGPDYFLIASRSLALAVAAAAATVTLGVLLGYAQRVIRSPASSAAVRFANLGYAIPGTVLAIGILYPLASFDNLVDGMARQVLGISTGLLLTGSVLGLLFAYSVRFLAVATGAIETGFGRIRSSLDMAARSLGRTTGETLREIHLPLIRPALASAALLVFVDAMKELPATLLLRPFNFETLATFVYGAASRESFEDGSLAALTIVAVGLIPVALLGRIGRLRRSPSAGGRGSAGTR